MFVDNIDEYFEDFLAGDLIEGEEQRAIYRSYWHFAQIGIALAVALAGVRVEQLSLPFVGVIEFSPLMGTLFTVAWLVAITNAFNLIDGLDGLASGASALVASAFVIVAFWQVRHEFYGVPPADALDLAIVAAAILGACAGFLWWNAAPARIFMGDTGSLALGGGLAGLALLTRTHLLLPIMGGLFVIETLSVVIQVISFRGFGRRVFRMAPIHHHFELAGWPEFTVIVRFWLIAGLFVSLALGLFYADFLRIPGALD
jgi:phospho-N-acetylmuramoyl-pentapeptide-transferase